MALPGTRYKAPSEGDLRFLDPQTIARVSNLELVARFIVEGFLIGLHQSPYHGFSSEFTSYRKYVKGDPFKFVVVRSCRTRWAEWMAHAGALAEEQAEDDGADG